MLAKSLKIVKLAHGNEAKPISVIRPTSKILKVTLHRNKVKLKNLKVRFSPQ